MEAGAVEKSRWTVRIQKENGYPPMGSGWAKARGVIQDSRLPSSSVSDWVTATVTAGIEMQKPGRWLSRQRRHVSKLDDLSSIPPMVEGENPPPPRQNCPLTFACSRVVPPKHTHTYNNNTEKAAFRRGQ